MPKGDKKGTASSGKATQEPKKVTKDTTEKTLKQTKADNNDAKGKKRAREEITASESTKQTNASAPAKKQSEPEFKVPSGKPSATKKTNNTKPAPAPQEKKKERKQKKAPSATGSDIDESSSDLSFSEDPSTGSEVDMDSSSVDDIVAGDSLIEFNLDPETKAKVDLQLKMAKRQSAVDPSKGVIYLSHLPYGFFEPQLRSFFTQFGEVARVRLSRSKRSGRSKGYAWVEFPEIEVAKIAAETMNNYLMYGRRLTCEFVPADKLNPAVFKGADRKFKTIPWRDINRARHNKVVTEEDYMKHVSRLVKGDEKKKKKLAELGLDYDFPGYKDGVVPDASMLPAELPAESADAETEAPKPKRAKKN